MTKCPTCGCFDNTKCPAWHTQGQTPERNLFNELKEGIEAMAARRESPKAGAEFTTGQEDK